MPSLPVYDMKKEKVGSVELSDAVFAAEVRPHLLNDAVRAQIAWRHENKTANSLTRSEVQASGKKIFRQKGTGQARHGDIKAPIFVGGGKAHGPRPRRVVHKMNKKAMRGALISVLSLNQKQDRLFIVDKLELKKTSTKDAGACLKHFGLDKALVITTAEGDLEKNFVHSVRNVTGVKCLRPEGINVFDVLKFRNLIISKNAAKKITERLSHV
ncbi:50S ribosomal protein L4 [bacterium]|nr:50S ribosomal protein L4 [bacterium]NBX82318.1 50S ribosomal protein L4 [bacterium]